MKNADFKQLALLCELIDTQSLTEAALRMAISPSAASQSLARLRDILGDPICVRHGQGYRLTPYGESAIDEFRQLVRQWRQVSEGGDGFDPRTCVERLSVAHSEAVAIMDPAELYVEVSRAAPLVTLDLQAAENSLDDIIALRAAQVDLVCTHRAPPADATDLHSAGLGDWRATMCCLGKNHPRIGDSLSMAQYLAEVHLLTLYGNRREFQTSLASRSFEARGWRRRTSLVQSIRVAADILSRTDRLVTCNAEQARMIMRLAPDVRCLPLPPELELPAFVLHMVWHQRTHDSAAHRWLREQVKLLYMRSRESAFV
ncbi:MAG: LysR family transcriptional regulator [Hydrogenophaga sp.]|nr:LysR family transcriptional regulator [Hydrogenophaga sp.]